VPGPKAPGTVISAVDRGSARKGQAVFERLSGLAEEYARLEHDLADAAVHSDPERARALGRRYGELTPVVPASPKWQQTLADEQTARELSAEDHSFAAEADEFARHRVALEGQLNELLAPRDAMDGKDVLLEVKAGEGGEESALFAGDLLRMYLRYAERQGWKTEVLDATVTGLGGYKDATVAVKAARRGQAAADGVWARLKYEGGVHRVQRVPVTESQGRIHTSAAGVLVLPEADPVEVTIDPADLRVDVFRSSGPGGQSVNTTDSAVRITHLPTGIVVSCQNERSQIQNRASAMLVLQAKLLERRRQEERALMDSLKDTGTSWGNQMRSYVLHPYQMVKDLRTEYEVGNPTAVLDGDIDGFIEAGIRWRRNQG
jgi:peptide chain release factor 1